MAYIEINNIHHSFGNLEVLKGVNMKIEQNSFVTIMGKSGAGKTTLLQVVGTLLTPTSGQVIIDNTDVFKLKDKQLAAFRNRHIGFIFQFHQLLAEFTALENVMMPALIAKTNYRQAQQRAKELLERMQLSERLEHKPSELSGGEKQRVAVCRALMMNPSVILADEPSGSLDSQNKKELHKLLLDVKQQFKQTIIVVTHDEELAKISDKVYMMQDGVVK